MKRIRRLVMTTGLISVCSILALAGAPRAAAQSAPGWYDHDGDRDGDHDHYRRDHDRDDYRQRGVFLAHRFGFEDGFNDGINDRRTGHSFRPTHSRNFRHADRGFDGRFVSHYQYKENYRNSYEEGYRRGYNSGGWRR
ncbi:MAG TPA: hypothetical protein VNW97_23445 [Candidatus Saccharimonadales bacterium]|jgi:hypothetical protein|nr:hypothetical protein [Candidatus Saccharimonadales bacterium]